MVATRGVKMEKASGSVEERLENCRVIDRGVFILTAPYDRYVEYAAKKL